MKFRKKPVVIEAVRFFGSENAKEVDDFAPGNFSLVHPDDRGDDPEIVAEVYDELHSTWVGVKAGQWIIRGVQGEFYPCDATVFAGTYEAVDQ